jgi:hypothetical protein
MVKRWYQFLLDRFHDKNIGRSLIESGPREVFQWRLQRNSLEAREHLKGIVLKAFTMKKVNRWEPWLVVDNIQHLVVRVVKTHNKPIGVIMLATTLIVVGLEPVTIATVLFGEKEERDLQMGTLVLGQHFHGLVRVKL